MNIRKCIALLSAAVAVVLVPAVSSPLFAQGKGPEGFPNRTVKLVNGFQPGGGSDIVQAGQGGRVAPHREAVIVMR